MEFFKCSIAGVSYGTGVTEIERVAAARRSEVCTTARPTALICCEYSFMGS